MLPLVLALFAQDVTLRVSPEPLAVTRRLGNVQGLGVWRVVACSESAEPLTLDGLRIEMAIEHLALIDPDTAFELLRSRGNERARVRLARILGMTAVTATALVAGGYLGVTAKEAGLIGLGIEMAGRARGRIEQEVLVLDRSKMLEGSISLPPGGCAARLAFAGLVKNAGPRTYRLKLPPLRRPVIPGLTSIPP